MKEIQIELSLLEILSLKLKEMKLKSLNSIWESKIIPIYTLSKEIFQIIIKRAKYWEKELQELSKNAPKLTILKPSL